MICADWGGELQGTIPAAEAAGPASCSGAWVRENQRGELTILYRGKSLSFFENRLPSSPSRTAVREPSVEEKFTRVANYIVACSGLTFNQGTFLLWYDTEHVTGVDLRQFSH